MSADARARSWIAGLGGWISAYLVKLLFAVLVALVLFGAVSQGQIVWLLALFVGSRGLSLVREALRRSLTAADWERLYGELAARHGQAAPDERAREARKLGLAGSLSPSELARARVASLEASYEAPRARREIACEALGLLAFALLIPADVALYTRDFVSLRGSRDWVELGVAAFSVGLYAWPFLWQRSEPLASRRRMLWWALWFVAALPLLCAGIAIRHPYLDPFRADRARLAAHRVLSLKDTVVAANHADWVFDYARVLEGQGQSTRAIHFYREGLRLDPGNREAHARLAALEGRPRAGARDPASQTPGAPSPEELARAPLFEAGRMPPRLGRCEIDSGLEAVDRTTVVIVAVGDVGDWILDVVGDVIQRELSLPACVAPRSVPLPGHTRVRGFAVGPQWDVRALAKAFSLEIPKLPQAPVKYVLVTPADIYSDGSNFLFSGAFAWGALISFARFGDLEEEGWRVVHRLAKQTLGALAKSFGVPASMDPGCVTSYTNGLEQFEAKGNRLNAESLAIFRSAVREIDERWSLARSLRSRDP